MLFRAALWMVGAILAFSSMAIAGRVVRTGLDTFELMLYRSLIGIVLVLIFAGSAGTLRQISHRRLGLHLVRNISHFAGQNLWFFALPLIPLAQLFALEFTAPLWVALLAPIIIAERLTRTRALAAILGFVGILIIVRPDTASLNAGTIAAASCAICFAGSALFTKRLTQTETITCILFWLTFMQAILGLGCSFIDGELTLPQMAHVPWLALIGAAGLAAHFCLTRALSIAPASVVMPIDFARLPVIAIVGMLFYDEVLQPEVFVGAAVIFYANSLNLRPKATPRSN
ncbi:DMT family transporter [Actibacterium lipolyticum]|nr:DMT family transporter [Actibacterium lipolyticum]